MRKEQCHLYAVWLRSIKSKLMCTVSHNRNSLTCLTIWHFILCIQVAGFSGTNDNEPLLPLTVKCMSSEDTHIQATDGRMLCMLTRPGKCTFTPLVKTQAQDSDNAQQKPMWNRLLDLAIETKAHALIDAGETSLPRLDSCTALL
jgi:hypothetical protein